MHLHWFIIPIFEESIVIVKQGNYINGINLVREAATWFASCVWQIQLPLIKGNKLGATSDAVSR